MNQRYLDGPEKHRRFRHEFAFAAVLTSGLPANKKRALWAAGATKQTVTARDLTVETEPLTPFQQHTQATICTTMITPLEQLLDQHGEVELVTDNAVSHSCSFSSIRSSRVPANSKRRRLRTLSHSGNTAPRCKGLAATLDHDAATADQHEQRTDSPTTTAASIEFPVKDASCWESSPPVVSRRSLLAFMGLRMPRRCDSFDATAMNPFEDAMAAFEDDDNNDDNEYRSTADLIADVLSDLHITDDQDDDNDEDSAKDASQVGEDDRSDKKHDDDTASDESRA